MGSKKYAFIVDREVFDVLDFESAPQELIDRCVNGFSGRVLCLDVTDFDDADSIGIGSTFNLGKFDNSNLLNQNSDVFQSSAKRKYCFISKNKVFLILRIDNEQPNAPIWENAFKSKITVADVSGEDNIGIGDIYHDKKFYAPGDIDLEKVDTSWGRWRDSLGSSRPWDVFLESKRQVPEDEQKYRLSVCLKCPSLLKPTNQCKECGCFMSLKVKLSASECPIGKW